MHGGCRHATIEHAAYDFPGGSAITCMELRAGQMLRPHESPILDVVMAEFQVIQIDQMVSESAIEAGTGVRGKH